MEIFHVLPKVTLTVVALQILFTLSLFAGVWEEREIHKGCETQEAIKSLAFSCTVL